MKHKYEGVWLTDDLEGFRCKNCGFESVDPNETLKCPHWYYIEITECVICGSGYTYRTRKYGIKPKDYWETHVIHETLCGKEYAYESW